MRERKWSVEFTGKVLLCIIMMLFGIMFANERIYAAGTNLSNAEYFEIGSGRSGSFGNGMSKKYYKFHLSQNSCIRFNLKTGGHYQTMNLTIKDSTGRDLPYCTDMTTSDIYNWGYQRHYSSYALNAGTYYIELRNWAGYEEYSFNTYLDYTQNETQVIGGQKNKYLNNAVSFSVGSRLVGVGTEDDCYYKFTLSKTSDVKFNYIPDYSDYGAYMYFSLFDSNGQKRISFVECTSNNKRTGYFTGQLTAGTYYLNVKCWGGKNPYVVKTTAAQVTTGKPTTPKPGQAVKIGKMKNVSVNSPVRTKLRVNWKKISCSGYQVQCSRNRTFTQIIKSRTISNRYKSYTLKGLKSKRRYYARVRAYKYANGRKVYSSWSIVRSVKIK